MFYGVFSHCFSITVMVAVFTSVQARELTVQEKESDINQLVSQMIAGYGPLQFKAQTLGLTPEGLRARYMAEAAATRSSYDFNYVLVRLVSEFKDSHFGASVNSTRVAYLPISTEGVNGKVYIENVNRSILPESTFPFVKGDEIVEVDRQPVEQVLRTLIRHIPAGYESTAWRLAAIGLSYRAESRFPIPTTELRLKIRRGTSTIIDEVSLPWKVEGEAPLDDLPPRLRALRTGAQPLTDTSFATLSVGDIYSDFDKPFAERTFRCSGNTRVTIPRDATVIMTEPFVAYYHPTARGNIGYLRIPHYSPKNPSTGVEEYDLRFAQYEYAVNVLEQNTVGLIIDQDHNCGGSVDFLHRMVSLFTHTPVDTMRFRLLANRQEYANFRSWRDSLNPSTIAYGQVNRVLDLIRVAWQNGDYMTPMTAVGGDPTIVPNPIRYTKPIVMLIDELSGSGGDAFPAILQGIGRAKLLGTRTMGAGGHVQEQPNFFFSQVKLRMTKSLFYRPDGTPVENNGVNPDYPYNLTRDDFMYGYIGYQRYYLSKLFENIH